MNFGHYHDQKTYKCLLIDLADQNSVLGWIPLLRALTIVIVDALMRQAIQDSGARRKHEAVELGLINLARPCCSAAIRIGWWCPSLQERIPIHSCTARASAA